MSNVVLLPTPLTESGYDHNARPPSFILPTDLNEISDEQLDTILEHVRTVRLLAHHRFNETKKLRNTADKMKLSTRYDRAMAALAKELDKFDKFEEKLTKASNDVRALRLQLGQDPM